MTDSKNGGDLFIAPAAADSPQAQKAMDALVKGVAKIEKVEMPRVYRYNHDAVNSFEAVREFIQEMSIQCVVFPGVDLKKTGRNPDLWIEIPMPKEDDAANTNI